MSNIIAEKINKDNVSVFSIEEGGLMIYNQLTENTHLLKMSNKGLLTIRRV